MLGAAKTGFATAKQGVQLAIDGSKAAMATLELNISMSVGTAVPVQNQLPSAINPQTGETIKLGDAIIINNQSSSSSSGDKSASGDTVTAMEGALTDSTDGAVFVAGSSAYDILHKGA